jgi:hypothetical protein
MGIVKNGQSITTLAAWEELGGPKSKEHWVADRSAMEVARAWLEVPGRMPREVCESIERHRAFGAALSWSAEPEARLRFDGFAGEPRNSDLAVAVTDAHGAYLMAVEAKADEPFGATVAETLADSAERYVANPRSNGVARVLQLAQSMLHPAGRGAPLVGLLRYQLFTACAGAICEAERRQMDRALLLVQEFVTRRTKDERHRSNAGELDAFVSRISRGQISKVASGDIHGPFVLPCKPLFTGRVSFYIGKVTRNLREHLG